MSEPTILSLQQRRELEQAVVALEQTPNEHALRDAARKIVHTYPSEAVLKVILKHLATPSSQLRGGLGHLSTLLPLEMTVATLRHYAANRENASQGRQSAVMILERFLAETVSPGVLGDLQDNSDAAFQSLSEAVEEGKQNRHVLLDYVTQMQEYGEEIAFAVLEALDRLPAADRVDLLRLLAQDTRKSVAQAALTRLEALAAPGDLPSAVRGLATLLPVLNKTFEKPVLDPIERTLRKVQMRGKGFRPIGVQDAGLQDAGEQDWRALVSPADVSASQSIWLIHPAADAKSERPILNLIVNLRFGLAAFYVSEGTPTPYFAARQPVGKSIQTLGDRMPNLFLEAPARYAIWLIQHALRIQQVDEKVPNALSGEYKLYNDLIWQFNVPTPPESVRPYLEASEQPAPPAISTLTSAHATAEAIEADVTHLMTQPAMQMWRLPIANNQSPAKSMVSSGKLPAAQFATALLNELAGLPESQELITSMLWGLRAQAAWFTLANDPLSAAAAHRLSQIIPTLPIVQNLLLRRMIEEGMKG